MFKKVKFKDFAGDIIIQESMQSHHEQNDTVEKKMDPSQMIESTEKCYTSHAQDNNPLSKVKPLLLPANLPNVSSSGKSKPQRKVRSLSAKTQISFPSKTLNFAHSQTSQSNNSEANNDIDGENPNKINSLKTKLTSDQIKKINDFYLAKIKPKTPTPPPSTIIQNIEICYNKNDSHECWRGGGG